MNPITSLDRFFLNVAIPYLGLNFIDILIIVVIFFYCIEGYALGFIRSTIDFISFIGSFILGLTFYSFFARILVDRFSIPQGFANAIGFFIAAFISELILALVLRKFLDLLYSTLEFENRSTAFIRINRFFGILPGILSSIVLLSFILTMIISLPISPFLKNLVSQSRFGNSLVSDTLGFEKALNTVFGGAVSDALTFLTIEPKSDQSVNLNFKTESLTIDYTSEQEMFTILNKERNTLGLKPLSFNEPLAKVGRAHCSDMLKRGYFSHFTPEGLSPFDRMANANIEFIFAGENLALAPNSTLAMQGLMNSPGHRANILSENFGKIGIGVIDGGVYGKMFCQEFSD